jgi:putative PEP-CTERM system histidine kinase
MQGLIALWSHGVAVALFAALLMWRLSAGPRQPAQRLLLAAFAVTALWAWMSALGPDQPLASFAESARNLVWVGLLYSLSAASDRRQHGLRLVYGAVAAVIGMQLIADTLLLVSPSLAAVEAGRLLRVTTAAGALVLVHNIYGQAAPSSRSSIRLAMLGLALIWSYDLNLYTVAYLDSALATGLFDWRGLAVSLTAPLFALGAKRDDGWRIHLSRAATFQSLSLLAICGYLAVMAVLATALRGSGWDWSGSLLVALLAVMTVGAMVLLPSARARSWAKVKLAKHLFEHRYDYRSEWLRFTETVGRSGGEERPLSERIIKAFADILDAPGGLLLVADGGGTVTLTAAWNWPGDHPPVVGSGPAGEFWSMTQERGRVIELDSYRSRLGDPCDLELPIPQWMVVDRNCWAGVPLIHHDRLVGIVLLAAPEYRRPLDWEDFDLLRTAGRQAASSLAEAHGQEALSNAQRFEEFNRRFAFILHDIKNLVSQLSLLTRNAERHAGNPEFRDDMIATLKSSVGKMNDLLARLSPQASPRAAQAAPVPLRPIISSVVAGKRRLHDIQLLGDSSMWVMADAAALEQAFSHLLQNAIEASPVAEPVIVRLSQSGGGVAVTISDKGSGMDGEFIRNRLFQPFVSTKANGFGIGSFEARALIQAMAGRLTVDSQPGRGTSFTILLPAAELLPAERQRKIA